jgi:uncharacterized protein (TIGR02145 family)
MKINKLKLIVLTLFCIGLTDLQAQTVKDNDSNVYKTVIIGTQVWMAENLKTTKYNDNSIIPLVTDSTEWATLTTPAYCWYNNDATANKNTYGALYNWYTVNTKKLCPTGWHVPSDTEWTTLTDYLTNNGYGYGGSGDDIAKSMAATSGWPTNGILGTVSNDQASNNSSGFTALPSGLRSFSGAYGDVGDFGTWWSSTEISTTNAYYRTMYYFDGSVSRGFDSKQLGFSVRCLRN